MVYEENDERDKKIVALLTNNKMDREDIAAAMGLSMATTNRMLNRLVAAGIVDQEGSTMHRKFYVSKDHYQEA